jgi:trans-aconitate 2-methyltransferase
MSWNPQQYLKFAAERLRPAYDLLARAPVETPWHIADLGCGTGTVTALIKDRWPQAHIAGIDSSQAMLDRARAAVPEVTWELGDISKWTPAVPVDLLVSNAALQWLDHHETLFPGLVSKLNTGGVLAVQMPASHDSPSHRIGYELAESDRWRSRLKGLVRRHPILDPGDYHEILRPHISVLDLWTTEYVHALTGENPVAEFTKGSFVGAWLSALPEPEAREFEAQYCSAIAAAYPQRPGGVTLFPFRRFFLIAKR